MVLTIVNKLRAFLTNTWNRSVAIFLKYRTLTRPRPTVYTSIPAACKILAGRTTLSRVSRAVTSTSTLLLPHVGLPRNICLLTYIRARAVFLRLPRNKLNFLSSRYTCALLYDLSKRKTSRWLEAKRVRATLVCDLWTSNRLTISFTYSIMRRKVTDPVRREPSIRNPRSMRALQT